jgi:hypothetical protein
LGEFGATIEQYLVFRLSPEDILPGVNKLKAVKDTDVLKS